MTITSSALVLPAPTFWAVDGAINEDSTIGYARLIIDSWIPRVLLSGPMGYGEYATTADRTSTLDLWLRISSSDRLLAACWTNEDIAAAQVRDVQPLVMIQARTSEQLRGQLQGIPKGAWVYANPRYSAEGITPALVAEYDIGGVKLSKVGFDELQVMREINPATVIIHGSSRNIAESFAAGANLVTTPPLAAVPARLPLADLATVQYRVDEIQRRLDVLPNHHARVEAITRAAQQAT
jgi:dihydrodipicolinate synthase/N-acetylneuraminate lyase